MSCPATAAPQRRDSTDRRIRKLEDALDSVDTALAFTAWWFRGAHFAHRRQVLEIMTHALTKADAVLNPKQP